MTGEQVYELLAAAARQTMPSLLTPGGVVLLDAAGSLAVFSRTDAGLYGRMRVHNRDVDAMIFDTGKDWKSGQICEFRSGWMHYTWRGGPVSIEYGKIASARIRAGALEVTERSGSRHRIPFNIYCDFLCAALLQLAKAAQHPVIAPLQTINTALVPEPDAPTKPTVPRETRSTAPLQRPTPYTGTQPYIFVSYAHRDADRVLPIIARMQTDGWRIWYDEGITPGAEWDRFVARKLLASSCVLAMFTENYFASENCLDELMYARGRNIPRQPVHLEAVELPPEVEMRMGRTQAVLYYSFQKLEQFYQKLYSALPLQLPSLRGQ